MTGSHGQVRRALRGVLSPFDRASETRGSECECYVRDNGIGIPADKQATVFQPFQRLREVEGTGIGLALVKSIVTRHGGRIWVESDPGSGTTFRFTLPQT